ncbi:hypothetical protein WDU94_005912 [Cyamophila willieti]
MMKIEEIIQENSSFTVSVRNATPTSRVITSSSSEPTMCAAKVKNTPIGIPIIKPVVFCKNSTEQKRLLAKINENKMLTKSRIVVLSSGDKLGLDKIGKIMVKKENLILGDESSIDNSIVEEIDREPMEKSSNNSTKKGNSVKLFVRKDLIECTPDIIGENPTEELNEEILQQVSNSYDSDEKQFDEKQDQKMALKELKILKKISQMDTEKLAIPLLEYGWRREIVHRKSATNDSFAVYYHSPPPNSRKIMCKSQLADELSKPENLIRFPSLTVDHFTFSKVSLGLGEPFELERNAHERRENPKELVEITASPSQDQEFTCTHCSAFKSSDAFSLVQHGQECTAFINSSYSSDKCKYYVCFACSFYTHVKHTLLSHIRKHIREKPFKCHLCNFWSIQRNELQSHLRRIHLIL